MANKQTALDQVHAQFSLRCLKSIRVFRPVALTSIVAWFNAQLCGQGLYVTGVGLVLVAGWLFYVMRAGLMVFDKWCGLLSGLISLMLSDC